MSAVQGLGEVIGALGRNPLPDAFVVTSRQDIAGELGKLPGVAHVQADAVWARRLAAAGAIAQLAIGVLAALLGAAIAVLLAGNGASPHADASRVDHARAAFKSAGEITEALRWLHHTLVDEV